MPTISDVQPNRIKHRATTNDPNIMNGRRRPYFDRDRSAITPINGWIIRPDRGPAIHTNDVRDFVRPSCSRYGVQSRPVSEETARIDGSNVQVISILQVNLCDEVSFPYLIRVQSQGIRTVTPIS